MLKRTTFTVQSYTCLLRSKSHCIQWGLFPGKWARDCSPTLPAHLLAQMQFIWCALFSLTEPHNLHNCMEAQMHWDEDYVQIKMRGAQFPPSWQTDRQTLKKEERRLVNIRLFVKQIQKPWSGVVPVNSTVCGVDASGNLLWMANSTWFWASETDALPGGTWFTSSEDVAQPVISQTPAIFTRWISIVQQCPLTLKKWFSDSEGVRLVT